MTFSGWVATLAGWWVTEIGRQPFLVYGMLRTAPDLVAPIIPRAWSSRYAPCLSPWLILFSACVVCAGVDVHGGSPGPAADRAELPQSPEGRGAPVAGPA